MLWDSMNERQQQQAKKLLKSNLTKWDDWIVLNNTMEALADWSISDTALSNWLIPRLEALQADKRRSVSGRAKKLLNSLTGL
jgi:hypothetical protein